MNRRNWLLGALVIALAVIPLVLPSSGRGGRFRGADDQAKALITEIRPDYTPWFHPVWQPPSGEVESLLFAVQAALGAGVVGYYLGLARGRHLRSGQPTRREEGRHVPD